MITEQDKAMALAEKHGRVTSRGTNFNRPWWFETSFDKLTALLTDHRQQVIEELAGKTGVMPWVREFDNEHFPSVCDVNEVREAIATMHARVKQLEKALEQIAELEGTEQNEWDCVERVMPEVAEIARAAMKGAGK